MTYPKTIDNGHGEVIVFTGRKVVDGITYLLVENEVSPESGPPLHVHHLQDERLTILEGKVGVEIPGKEISFYDEGETVHFTRGVVHRFWNAGTTTLKCKGEVWPPLNFEFFISEIFRSTKENNGRPSVFDAAYLLTMYQSEFAMASIPSFVKTVLFPVIILVGKLTGKYKRYENLKSQPLSSSDR